MICEKKKRLRKQMRSMLSLLTREEKSLASECLCTHLKNFAIWKSAKTVFGFASTDLEPDWFFNNFITKQFAFPRVKGLEIEAVVVHNAQDLTMGSHGILEPTGGDIIANFDLILVPGLAFDRKGGRLGRGKGYYDRFLAKQTAFKLGICFGVQLIEDISLESHDQRVNGVVTEKGVIIF